MTSALLIRLGGLGDLLAALPAMRLLRAAFPGASLRLLARREAGRLLREAGVVDEALDADDPAWKGLFDVNASAPLPWTADIILGWFHGRGGFAPHIRAISYAWDSNIPLNRFFFERTVEIVRERGRTPAMFEDCRLLFASPPPPDARSALRAKPDARSAGGTGPKGPRGGDELKRAAGAAGSREPRGEPFAVIHPGSGGRAKRWPLDRFLAVSAALAAEGIGGRIVTGEAEEDLESPLSLASLPSGWTCVSRPPLAALAEDLRRAAVYVGNDSGVTHLAAACGAPTVAIFRDDNLAAWRPAGPVMILSAARVEDVPADAVIRAIFDILNGNR